MGKRFSVIKTNPPKPSHAMKNILLLATIIGFSIGTLWGQDAPKPAPEPVAEPAAVEPAPAPEPAAEEDEARWSDFLPLNKEMAGGADLPLPLGIGVTVYGQEQDMKLTQDITLNISAALQGAFALPSTTISATADKVESDVDTNLVKLDAWILPFLNVYGVFGEVDGDNKVVNALVTGSATATALVKNAFGRVSYDGDVYGFGAVLAYSKDRWWGTLDYSYTETDLSISTSEIKTYTLSPRIGTTGQVGDFKGSIWIGGMHQGVDERQAGKVTEDLSGFDPRLVTPETISYDVQQEAEEAWNFLVGGSLDLSEQLNIAIEGGFGDREQIMGSLTFRF